VFVLVTERRHHPRIEYSGVIFVSWKTFDGQRNHVLGRGLDVSEQGIALALAIRIPAGSFVKVHADGLKLDGTAIVRHVTRKAGGYVLGLELNAPLGADVLAELGVTEAEAAKA